MPLGVVECDEARELEIADGIKIPARAKGLQSRLDVGALEVLLPERRHPKQAREQCRGGESEPDFHTSRDLVMAFGTRSMQRPFRFPGCDIELTGQFRNPGEPHRCLGSKPL